MHRPKSRMIDPGFWRNRKLGKLTPVTRLVFVGLISHADDEGRLPADAVLVRAQVLPFDDFTGAQVQEMLESLAALGFIILYTVDEDQYAQLVNWGKYQIIRGDRFRASEYPPPPCRVDDAPSSEEAADGSLTDVSQTTDKCQSDDGQMSDACLTNVSPEEKSKRCRREEILLPVPPTSPPRTRVDGAPGEEEDEEIGSGSQAEDTTATTSEPSARVLAPPVDHPTVEEGVADPFVPDPAFSPNQLWRLWLDQKMPVFRSIHWSQQEDALRRLHLEPPHWSVADIKSAVQKLIDDYHGPRLLEWAWKRGPVYLISRRGPDDGQGIEKVLEWRSGPGPPAANGRRETTQERLERRRRERREREPRGGEHAAAGG